MRDKFCSITLIVYNRLSYTKMTVESLLENTNFPYELIVVDNGSNDDVVNYLMSMRKNFDHLILNKKNIGKVNANNIGWRLSKGDYISTVENDILLNKDWLKTCIRYIETMPEIGLISPTNHDLDRYERGRTEKYEVTEYKSPINGLKCLIPNIGVIPGTIVAKREIIEKAGMHKTSGCLYEHSCPDYCKWVKFNGYLVAYPIEILGYHVDSGNKIFEFAQKKYNLDKDDYDNFKKLANNIKNKKDPSLIYNFLNIK